MQTKNYESPLMEVIEIELEGAILQASGDGTLSDIIDGGGAWS